ncbi:hypothetical protein, partial [Streptomyces ipomoeae]|uniref:hypothetical protein n=1 Tax=Streptomyces ipomoeae TaxID=103232 RepID=UPI0029A6545B
MGGEQAGTQPTSHSASRTRADERRTGGHAAHRPQRRRARLFAAHLLWSCWRFVSAVFFNNLTLPKKLKDEYSM